jgi:hypothetical protein
MAEEKSWNENKVWQHSNTDYTDFFCFFFVFFVCFVDHFHSIIIIYDKKKKTKYGTCLAGMNQSRPKCKIFGQARRPAPTKACRGDPLWSPVSTKFDFDVVLRHTLSGAVKKQKL